MVKLESQSRVGCQIALTIYDVIKFASLDDDEAHLISFH